MTHTPPARSGSRRKTLTPLVGLLATAVYFWYALIWAVPELLGLGFKAIALVFFLWVLGLPIYLWFSGSMKDAKLTKRELVWMVFWPFQLLIMALTSGSVHQRNDNTSTSTGIKGVFAWLTFIGLCLVSLGAALEVGKLFLDMIVTAVLLTVFVYLAGSVVYFWLLGGWRKPLGFKLIWSLLTYPGAMNLNSDNTDEPVMMTANHPSSNDADIHIPHQRNS